MSNEIHLAYTSQAVEPLTAAQVQTLAEKAEALNVERGITGILLYGQGRFFQLLEGDAEAVQDLYQNELVLDPRHTECQVLLNEPCTERLFPQWHMGWLYLQPMISMTERATHWDALCGEIAAQNSRAVFAREPAAQLIHRFIDQVDSLAA